MFLTMAAGTGIFLVASAIMVSQSETVAKVPMPN